MSVKVHLQRVDNPYKTKLHRALAEPVDRAVLAMEVDMAWVEKHQLMNILHPPALVQVVQRNNPLDSVSVDHLTKYLLVVVKDKDP